MILSIELSLSTTEQGKQQNMLESKEYAINLRMTVDEALAHPFLGTVRVPHKEIQANHTIPDVGELTLDQYRQLIWNAIQASPV